jgi:prepilin-type N-terminal cleavage/methylation domain-containing protein
MKAFRKNNGMTLLELLTVIAIIGIIAAVSIPSVIHMARGSKMRGGAKIVTDTMSAARGLAIAQRQSFFVEFDKATNRITIFSLKKTESNPNPNPDVAADRKYYGEWKKLPDPIAFYNYTDPLYAAPDDWIKFKPNGGASGKTNPGTVAKFAIWDPTTLGNPADLTKAKTCVIHTDNVTGRIKAVFE